MGVLGEVLKPFLKVGLRETLLERSSQSLQIRSRSNILHTILLRHLPHYLRYFRLPPVALRAAVTGDLAPHSGTLGPSSQWRRLRYRRGGKSALSAKILYAPLNLLFHPGFNATTKVKKVRNWRPNPSSRRHHQHLLPPRVKECNVGEPEMGDRCGIRHKKLERLPKEKARKIPPQPPPCSQHLPPMP